VECGRAVVEEEAVIVASRPTLLIRTKADLGGREQEGIAVSALTGEGIGELRRVAAERAFADRITLVDLEPSLTRERHRVALSRALVALTDSLPHLANGGDAVLAAHQVQQATNALDELLGVIDLEEVLDRVFSSFCVGK
jgi:tRNA modification GTPase